MLGRGEGNLGLFLQIVLNGINIALCIVLGLELNWGVSGVAWATVIGEFCAMLLGLAIVLRRFARSERLPMSRILDWTAYRHMMSLNRDIMIRSFSLLAAFALFTRQCPVRHGDAGRQCRADELLPDRRLFPRWLRHRG